MMIIVAISIYYMIFATSQFACVLWMNDVAKLVLGLWAKVVPQKALNKTQLKYLLLFKRIVGKMKAICFSSCQAIEIILSDIKSTPEKDY